MVSGALRRVLDPQRPGIDLSGGGQLLHQGLFQAADGLLCLPHVFGMEPFPVLGIYVAEKELLQKGHGFSPPFSIIQDPVTLVTLVTGNTVPILSVTSVTHVTFVVVAT